MCIKLPIYEYIDEMRMISIPVEWVCTVKHSTVLICVSDNFQQEHPDNQTSFVRSFTDVVYGDGLFLMLSEPIVCKIT